MSKVISSSEVNNRHGDVSGLPNDLREADSAELESVEGGWWLGDVASAAAGGLFVLCLPGKNDH